MNLRRTLKGLKLDSRRAVHSLLNAHTLARWVGGHEQGRRCYDNDCHRVITILPLYYVDYMSTQRGGQRRRIWEVPYIIVFGQVLVEAVAEVRDLILRTVAVLASRIGD